MPFDSKTAKAAARRRWEKHNAQPDYTKTTAPRMPKGSEQIEIAAEMPVSFNFLAAGIAKWEDPVLELSQTGYVEMRRNYAILKAHRRMAVRTAKLNWTVVGHGARAVAVAEIFGQIRAWLDFIDHCTGSIYEGTRPYQIKQMPAREGSMEPWAVPDFWMGGRHRYNAGGDIEWDGADTLRQIQRSTGVATRQAMDLPRDQFAIHRPGPGSNPEGYLDIGVALYNAVARPSNRAVTSTDMWVRLFALPAAMIGGNLDAVRPGAAQKVLAARAREIDKALGTGKATGLSNDDIVRLLQADPSGLTGLVAWLQHLEGIADDIITMGALLSSSGVAQADRTGNTETHAGEKDDAAFANAVAIAETFNRDVMPWIISRNPGLPELQDGEPEVYLWPDNPTEDDAQDISVDSEGADGDIDAPDDDGPDNDVLNVKAAGADMQAMMIRETLADLRVGEIGPLAARAVLRRLADDADVDDMIAEALA
jgi:hypothetical protein